MRAVLDSANILTNRSWPVFARRTNTLQLSNVFDTAKSVRRSVDEVGRTGHPAERHKAEDFPSSGYTSPVSLKMNARDSNALRCRRSQSENSHRMYVFEMATSVI
jgi:hypothetical protein